MRVVLTGGGTGEDFTGILNAGINVQGLGSDSVLDAIFKARTKVRVTGRARPTAVVLHPNDWEVIRLANRHPRVSILNPGPGVGGHCIAVDPWFIVASAPERASTKPACSNLRSLMAN